MKKYHNVQRIKRLVSNFQSSICEIDFWKFCIRTMTIENSHCELVLNTVASFECWHSILTILSSKSKLLHPIFEMFCLMWSIATPDFVVRVLTWILELPNWTYIFEIRVLNLACWYLAVVSQFGKFDFWSTIFTINFARIEFLCIKKSQVW